jgi:hypothetical protein
MLRVTVELVPFGDESRKSVIASARIWNEGYKMDDRFYNYGYCYEELNPIDGKGPIVHADTVTSLRVRPVCELIGAVMWDVSEVIE